MAEIGEFDTVVTDFKGLRDDLGEKFVPGDYFFRINNFNYDDIIGANKILFPSIVLDQSTTSDVDGIFEFIFRDPNDINRSEEITVIGGKIFRNWLGTIQEIYSGLTPGNKISFSILNDRLFMTNGVDFPLIYDGTTVWEMGSAKAEDKAETGLLTGTFFYEITYLSGVESRPGTKSNVITVSGKRITLDVPIGYAGTTARKVYRTIAGGSSPKLVATIADNTTTEFIDNVADASLGATIIAVNDEHPKPRFIEVNSEKIVGCVVEKTPTQIFVGEADLEFWNNDNAASNVSGVGNDNTPLVGMDQDYNQLVVGSGKQIYLVDVSGSLASITQTTANIGVKDGYSMVNIPDNEDFRGGIMFVSVLNDIRVFSGNIATPLSTSLDNLRTDNWAQVIRGSLVFDLEQGSNIYAEFFDYKYHLMIGEKFYVFDIRGSKWTNYRIMTENFDLMPNVFGIVGGELYVGQQGASIIERFYQDVQYRGENVIASLETPNLQTSEEVKFFKELHIYYNNASKNKIDVTITVESQIDNQIEIQIEIDGGSFDPKFFSTDDFETSEDQEDYKVIYINQYGRWIEFKLSSEEGNIGYRGYRLVGRRVSNKETVS